MKINYHLLTIFEYDQTRITKQQKQHHHNNRPKQLLLKASFYLSIGYEVDICNLDGEYNFFGYLHEMVLKYEPYYLILEV